MAVTGKYRNAIPRWPPAHDGYREPTDEDLSRSLIGQELPDPLFTPEESARLDKQLGIEYVKNPTDNDIRKLYRDFDKLVRQAKRG